MTSPAPSIGHRLSWFEACWCTRHGKCQVGLSHFRLNSRYRTNFRLDHLHYYQPKARGVSGEWCSFREGLLHQQKRPVCKTCSVQRCVLLFFFLIACKFAKDATSVTVHGYKWWTWCKAMAKQLVSLTLYIWPADSTQGSKSCTETVSWDSLLLFLPFFDIERRRRAHPLSCTSVACKPRLFSRTISADSCESEVLLVCITWGLGLSKDSESRLTESFRNRWSDPRESRVHVD